MEVLGFGLRVEQSLDKLGLLDNRFRASRRPPRQELRTAKAFKATGYKYGSKVQRSTLDCGQYRQDIQERSRLPNVFQTVLQQFCAGCVSVAPGGVLQSIAEP